MYETYLSYLLVLEVQMIYMKCTYLTCWYQKNLNRKDRVTYLKRKIQIHQYKSKSFTKTIYHLSEVGMKNTTKIGRSIGFFLQIYGSFMRKNLQNMGIYRKSYQICSISHKFEAIISEQAKMYFYYFLQGNYSTVSTHSTL